MTGIGAFASGAVTNRSIPTRSKSGASPAAAVCGQRSATRPGYGPRARISEVGGMSGAAGFEALMLLGAGALDRQEADYERCRQLCGDSKSKRWRECNGTHD